MGNNYLKTKMNRKFGLTSEETANYLINDCKFIIEKIDAFDMYDLIEKLLIAIFRKQGEPLLNTDN